MKHLFKKGDIKTFEKIITAQDIAVFESGVVHEVYSSFSLAKDAEWCGRLFVLDMKEQDEEGIGTKIHVNHYSPAFIGEKILFTTTFIEITDRNEILTTYIATVDKRIIAKGIQGQKIINKVILDQKFKAVSHQSSI